MGINKDLHQLKGLFQWVEQMVQMREQMLEMKGLIEDLNAEIKKMKQVRHEKEFYSINQYTKIEGLGARKAKELISSMERDGRISPCPYHSTEGIPRYSISEIRAASSAARKEAMDIINSNIPLY